MRAVAYAAGRLDDPPYELRMAYMIERWGSPWEGGWLEWPAALLFRMQAVKSYADAMSNYKRYGGQKGFVGGNPAIWETVTAVWDWCKRAGLDWRKYA